MSGPKPDVLPLDDAPAKNVDKRPIAALLRARSGGSTASRLRLALDRFSTFFAHAPFGERRLVCMRCMQPRRLGAVGERSALARPFDFSLSGVASGGGSRRLGGGGGDVEWSGPYPVSCPRGSPPGKFQFPVLRGPGPRTRRNPCPGRCRTGRLPSRSWRRVRPRG